ncbi:PNRC domain containing protein [Pyrenophora tritici-repentis]|nr:PNRC domain-containing protein [Pyrenophora tritici-repentis]KAI1580722.1 Atrophin-1 domain containing protein [Pyrenophora tritici-repentis]KAI1603231.1 Atrophin-1 domain containing protein [Pyrenophora tritici-repentis]KAI2487483.1 PNRC domain containing protein [Pyrenophora tritici-repentis]PWO25161.1 major facilitator superfamily MFS-1 [Pyrenophora tritici-repentis]
MSTAQIAASPRAPRGKPQSPAQAPNKTPGRQSQRKPRNQRAPNSHNDQNAPGASPRRLPADAADSAAYSGEESQRPTAPRSMKKHHQAYASDRVFSPAESAPVPIHPSATPVKIQGAYAGPTFHASPAPSALPIPKFLSRSVPAKTRAGPPTPPPEDMTFPPRNEQSPLDLLFQADAAERANNNFGGPIPHSPFHQARPHHFKHDSYHSLNGVFPLELDGESKKAHMSPPPAASPASQRSVTDPNKVPQLKDMHQPGNGNDVMQDLLSRLSMSQKNSTAATPPQPGTQALPASQSRQTPSPFLDGRPLVRSASGPTTPQTQPPNQDSANFFYGNKNLSPLFKAAKGESPKRNSGLRTEITADSPMIGQGTFQGFASVPPHVMDPNTFSRDQPGHNHEAPSNARHMSAPVVQPFQQSPNNRRKTPAMNSPPASAPKPAVTMMSFVPASVAAKRKPATIPSAAAAPAPQMKTSTPSDSSSLEQDLKRLLNLNSAGETSSVR